MQDTRDSETKPFLSLFMGRYLLIVIKDRRRVVGFHMTSLKFKLQNHRSYRDFTFTMY